MGILPRWLKGLIIGALCFQIAACGTIMHPEREGQRGGRLDVGVVILDGIGLLFFIIPGVIAYAVDFSNGTIYLPGPPPLPSPPPWPPNGASLQLQDLRAVRFDAKRYTPDSLRDIIRQQTGYSLDWRDPRLRSVRLRDKDELPLFFAQAARTLPQGPRLALAPL
jgi:hypothetical protein